MNTATAPMTVPSTITGTHYWVTFPVTALPRINWALPAEAHRAIMSLYPDNLPGNPRSTGGILFRLDHINDTLTVLAQSTITPTQLPAGARTLTLNPTQWNQTVGSRIRFRVALNPITRNGRNKTEQLVPITAAPDWAITKLTPAMTDIDIVNYRRETRGTRNTAPGLITIDTIDGTATIADPDHLNQLRALGVGRAKNYGCGLLTTQNIR